MNDLTVTLERKGGLDVAHLPGLKVRLTSGKGATQEAALELTPVVIAAGYRSCQGRTDRNWANSSRS